ncbi:hypothetical protein DMUE_2954 [Dictyocoela muelleri]|nr:hypothetical protein DMUE_2954 [Dictyocoela muelleri]
MKRNSFGRGMANVEFVYEKCLFNLSTKISEMSDSSKRVSFIKNVYENIMVTIGEYSKYLKEKNHIDNSTELNKETLEMAFQNELIKSVQKKEKHSKMFTEIQGIIKHESSYWLSKGKLDPKTEANFCNLQDRNIFYQTNKCFHGCNSNVSVDHLATRCTKLLNYVYKHRHDEIIRIIVSCLLNKYSLQEIKHIRKVKLKKIYEYPKLKIITDTPIRTDIDIQDNKPDIVLINQERKEILFIEVGVTNSDILNLTEAWKKRKYDLLAKEFGRMKKMKVEIIPFVMTWDGKVSSFNKKYREKLGISNDIFAYIQSVCLNLTFNCVADKRDFSYTSNSV